MRDLHRKYRIGDKVQVETKFGWETGSIKHYHYLDTGSVLLIKLEDGRLAACKSELCIKKVE